MNSLEIEQIILTHIATWQHFDPKRLARDNRNTRQKTVYGGVCQYWAVLTPLQAYLMSHVSCR